jgi:hypothetical protein
MRWNPRMGKHPALASQRIDQLFLDTTYASPKHTFPSQVWPLCSSQHPCRRSHGLRVGGALLLLYSPVHLSLIAQSCGNALQILRQGSVNCLVACKVCASNLCKAPFVCVRRHWARLLHFHRGQQRQHSLLHPACLPAALCYASVQNEHENAS